MIEESSNNAGPEAPVRFGAPEAAIVALGLALRFALFAAGRSPMDGDEGIMGIMAAHMARAEHFPIYFYAQHYMGTLEILPAALIGALGPEGWRFSVWPIRLAAAGIFVLLCAVHFRLSDRFFGARAARWSLLFLCVGTFYWVDYSTRLRHAALMMALGETTALLALRLADGWRAGKGVSLRRAFLLGLAAGVAWWHYQLVAVFFAALIPIFIAERGLYLLPLRRFPEGRGWDGAAALRIALMAAPALALARLSLGWLRLSSAGYPALVGGFLGALLLFAAWSWRVYQTERALGQESLALAAARFAPAAVLLGFAAGYAPAMLYLVRLQEEFWIGQPAIQLMRFWARLRDFILLDFASFLEITRPLDPDNPAVHSVTGRTYANLFLWALALYSLVRQAILGKRAGRLGAAWCLTLAAALLALHVIFPRPTDWNSPRFLVPLYAALAMALGLAGAELERGLAAAFPRAPRAARGAAFAAAMAGAAALWLPGWKPWAGEPMSWPSGHRAEAMDLLAALRERGIERADMPIGTEYVLLGYELAFASRLELRFSAGTLGDRLGGILDETRYGGEKYWIWRSSVARARPNDEPPPMPEGWPKTGSWAGRFYIVPWDPGSDPPSSGGPELGDFPPPRE